MRLFYFAFESIFDPVFDSQVLEFVKEFNQRSGEDEKITLAVLGSVADILRKNYRIKRKKIIDILEGNCVFFFKVPYFYRFPFLFKASLFLNMIAAFKVIFFFLRFKKSERAVFHCRTEIASFILLRIRDLFYKSIKIICDCRGVGSKEILYKYSGSKGIALSKKIGRIERFAHDNSDLLFCVSGSFKKFIQGNSQKPLDIEVIPCCINTEKFRFDIRVRDDKRKEMGISDRFVVLYSGSLNEWQLLEEMINIFKAFKKNIDNSIFILFTRDIEYARNLLMKSGLDSGSYIVEYKPFDIINKYLSIGDIGLLIREENDVNRVAFPIKFTEYVRSGVPVLTSITSDIGEFLDKYNTGFRIKDYNDPAEIEKIISNIKSDMDNIKSNEYKRKISGIVGEKIGWGAYIFTIINKYRDLING